MKKTLLFTALLCYSIIFCYGQNEYDKPFKTLGVGLKASTMGVGVEAVTSLNSYFKLRGGLNMIGFTGNYKIKIDDENIREAVFGDYDPRYKMKGKASMFNGHILVDFHPMKDFGIFHITAGFYLGSNSLKVDGHLIDPDGNRAVLRDDLAEWPSLIFDDYAIAIEENGDIKGKIHIGNAIKPYLGIGVGRTLAQTKNRFSFKCELGMIYQGDLEVRQYGRKVDIEKASGDSFEDVNKVVNLLKWWPMLNLQLSYRIF